MRRRRTALARRYGHASMMEPIHKATTEVQKLAKEYPLVTAGVVGAGAGLVIAELGAVPAMAVGAVAAMAIEKVTSGK